MCYGCLLRFSLFQLTFGFMIKKLLILLLILGVTSLFSLSFVEFIDVIPKLAPQNSKKYIYIYI